MGAERSMLMITPCGEWRAAAVEVVTNPEMVKGLFIKAGGSITMEDRNGTEITVTAVVDSIWPLRPYEVTAASNAFLLLM